MCLWKENNVFDAIIKPSTFFKTFNVMFFCDIFIMCGSIIPCIVQHRPLVALWSRTCLAQSDSSCNLVKCTDVVGMACCAKVLFFIWIAWTELMFPLPEMCQERNPEAGGDFSYLSLWHTHARLSKYVSHWDVKAHIIARGCEMLTFIGGGEGCGLLQNGRRFLRRLPGWLWRETMVRGLNKDPAEVKGGWSGEA